MHTPHRTRSNPVPLTAGRRGRCPLSVVALLVSTTLAAAQSPQPDRPPADRPALRGLPPTLLSLPPEERRKRLREFLENRLERAERARASLQQALKAVDDGAPLDDIAAMLPAEPRESRGPGEPRGPGGGPPGDHGDGDRPDINELGPVRVPGLPTGGDPAPGGGAGRPGRDRDGPITDEDRAAVAEFLASAAPPLANMMQDLRAGDPERADQRVREALPRMRGLLRLRETDRPLYDLRLEDIRHGREAFDAARELNRHDRQHEGATESADRAALLERLRTALGEQYRVRGEILAHETRRLERELARHRADSAAREGAREATIDRMVDRLRERAKDWMRRQPPREPE